MHLKKKLLSALLSASLLLSAAVGPMQAAAATEEEGNLAYGKTVTVSAGGTETHLDFVTDGVIADGWEYSYMHRTAAEAEDTSDKTYLTIDLGGSYSIDRIRYIGAMPADAGYYNTSHNMVIRISNDPNFEDESTRTVFNTDAGNYFGFGAGTDEEQVNSAEGIMVEFEAAEARYVRYYQHGASTVPTPGENCWPNALTACEIEVYAAGAETPPIDLVPQGNLAYGATVTGSEFNSAGVNTGGWWGGYDRNDLAEMAGGSINTDYWKAPRTNQGGETGEAVYVLFDLEEVQTLNNVKIWNYFKTNMDNRVYLNQVVQLSENGTDWVNVYNSDEEDLTGQDPSNSGQTVCEGRLENGTITGVKAGNDEAYEENSDGSGTTISFAPTQARYIRWWCSGKTDNPLPQMVQLQAYHYCTVTFDCGDGNTQSVQVPEGVSVSMPEAPVSDELGILFDKWTVGAAGGEEWDFTQPVTGDMTLVANWKTVPVHTVSFDSNGGSAVDPVRVTEGLLLTRPENPEKEGFVFAGWMLSGVPYRFNTPVTGDLTLTASWVLPSTPDAFVLRAGLLNITLDSYGRVTNLVSSLDGTDYYCPGPDEKLRSLISLVADYTIEEPTSLTYDEEAGVLTFGFASINATAKVALQEKGNYTSLTLTELEKPDGVSIQAILWGPVKTTITDGGQTVGAAYDDEYAIGMHMLNTKTTGGWPIEYKDAFYAPDLPLVNGFADPRVTRNIYSNTAAFSTWGSALQAYTWDYTQDTMRTIAYYSEVPQLQPAMTGKYADELASVIGSSIALYGTRPDNILNVISDIQTNEGLPHPTINGEWQKTSLETGQDFLVFNDAIWGLDVVENDAKMANAAGINYIYAQYGASGPWNGEGSYEFNGNFGGSDESASQIVDKAAEYGVYVGTHTLSNLISYGTKYTTPKATDALSYAGFAALTRDASASDTTLYVADGHPFSDEVVGASGGRREIRIGEELITYASCVQVSEQEWKLIGCLRGTSGTAAAAHAAGENAYKLWYYYVGLVGGWESLDPITTRMGEAFAGTGIHCMSYDSFESTKMSVYSNLLPAMYMKSVYNQVGYQDGFITEASDMDTNVWDVHSRISWGESNTPLNQMLNYLTYYRKNFFPAMLGWMYDHGNHGGYSEPNLLMNLSMKGGWNAGAGWYVNRNTFNQYPHMAGMLKTWNNAIQKGAFTVGEAYSEELQSAMRSAWTNGRIWTLEETVPDQEWVLQEVNKSNISEKIGEPVTLYATCDIDTQQPENGNLSTSTSTDYSRAHEGDVVTVYEQAHTGYRLVPGSLKVTGTDGTEYEPTAVTGETDAYTFTMPAQDVQITARFEPIPTADTTALKALYEAVKDMVQGSYSEESWEAFQSALSEAQAVLENASAGQAEVDAAFAALLQARDGLEREVNKELLKAIIKIAEETDTTGCTPSSVQALKEALASGRALLEDENAGQQQINEAVGAIHAALVNLVDQADKTALKALLEEASKLTEGKYTAASWEKLENAKEAAQAVLENADATPQEVEEAYDALLDALVGLELIPVDKSNLKVAIDLAKPIVAEADRYVATTIEGLSELLAEAEALYADEEATQEKVDEMAQRLLSASSQARLKANKTALKEAVEQAEGIDLSQYTEASAKALSAALAKANGILADESLTEDDQALVDQAASALRTAIDGLVKEGASDPDVSKPGESSQPGEPEEPSTGDSSPVLLIALFAGISALAILLLRRRFIAER